MAPRAGPPFFTRVSTLCWAGVSVVSYAAWYWLTNGGLSRPSAGAEAVAAAVGAALAAVAWLVTWIGGIVLALRSHSVLYTVVAVLPFPPVNSVLVALMARPPRTSRPGGAE